MTFDRTSRSVTSSSVTMLASSGTSLIPEAGSRYRLNLGPCELVLPLVVDRAVVEEVAETLPEFLLTNANLFAPGGTKLLPLPLVALLFLPPFSFSFSFSSTTFLAFLMVATHVEGNNGKKPLAKANSLIFFRLSR